MIRRAACPRRRVGVDRGARETTMQTLRTGGIAALCALVSVTAHAQHLVLGHGPVYCNNAGLMNQVTGDTGRVTTYPTTANYPGYQMTVKVESMTLAGVSCSAGILTTTTTCVGTPVTMTAGSGTSAGTTKTGGVFQGRVTYRITPYINGTKFGDSVDEFTDCPNPEPCPPQGCQTPILIPLRTFNRGNQIKISDAAHGVVFDIRGKGIYERVAWPIDAANVGFLGLDKNKNGVIDDGTELVGGALLEGAPNGWIALAAIAPTVGYLQPGNPLFDSLVIWIDRNRDGISTPDEIEPASHYLSWMALGGEVIGKKDQYGNRYQSTGLVSYVDRPDERRPVYDVVFATLPLQ